MSPENDKYTPPRGDDFTGRWAIIRGKISGALRLTDRTRMSQPIFAVMIGVGAAIVPIILGLAWKFGRKLFVKKTP